ncbi:toxin glutamine deamidase domain-containing protein [Marseilla massiliensis]|uniref:toxin glutamine deamidase domain-containing protein n=1 Tax=Marseilla massiliensis TaxID=1841864 RepID=UPI0030C7EA86
MAKRQKVKRFSVQTFDAAHYRQTEQYTQAVDALFDKATAEIARAAAKGKYDPDKPFSFDDYPSVKAVMQSVTKQLASRITTVIETGSKKQWLFACSKNDGFISSILDTSKLSKAQLKKMQDQNLDALKTFQGRKVEGMNLSQRIWKYVGQYREQLEAALDAGLGEGRSAAQLSRDVRQNLKDPNRLFRRVRDKRGNLVLSKAARAFHPGRGVYRSSAKNAARLTRSEINMAYRESDYLRWQSLDFVVGFEVKRSNHEPLCKCDICEKLKGRYPKHFKFKGWHPQCMCYAVPILMDEETFDENELGDLKAALRGTQYKRLEAKNVVVDVPDSFKEWVKEHEEAQANWSSTPYFIKDNFTDGKLSKGLNFETKKQIDPVQQQLNALMPQITQARMLASKWGLTVQLQMLDKYVAEKDIVRIPNRIATIQQKAAEIQQKDADIRAKCSEWGLNTYILDDAMKTPDSSNILRAIDELEKRVENAKQEYKAFINDANEAVKEARKYKIDVSDMLQLIATITGDKREWIMTKASCKEMLDKLKKRIQDAIDEANKPKADANSIIGKYDVSRADNEDEMEKSLGMHKAAAMNHDDANELKGNPNFTLGGGYHINCQSCVVAYEMRRRGYDVEANQNTKRKGNIPYELSYTTEKAWLDDNGNVPKKQRAGGRYVDGYKIKNKTFKVMMSEFEDMTSTPGRYHINFGWKNRRSGHIITMERFKDGTMRIYDPQCGMVITDFKAYAKRFSLVYGISILRVDNLRGNPHYVSGATKKRQ